MSRQSRWAISEEFAATNSSERELGVALMNCHILYLYRLLCTRETKILPTSVHMPEYRNWAMSIRPSPSTRATFRGSIRCSPLRIAALEKETNRALCRDWPFFDAFGMLYLPKQGWRNDTSQWGGAICRRRHQWCWRLIIRWPIRRLQSLSATGQRVLAYCSPPKVRKEGQYPRRAGVTIARLRQACVRFLQILLREA